MNTPYRALDVWLEQRRVGSLGEQGAIWTFSYDPDWTLWNGGFALSPSLPLDAGHPAARGVITDGGSSRPVQWFFDNLLPEEGQRTLLAADANLDQADAFSLLQYYGSESAGALTLMPPGQALPAGGRRLLTDEALSQRIANLPRFPLAHGAPKRMSMAGAQHKLAVVLDGQLYEPVGSTASTHILKPDHEDTHRYAHSVANEWFVMSLAGALKLQVPAVSIRRVPEPVYLIERFDREVSGDALRRLHMLDACQLLSLDRTYKYRMARAETFARLVGLTRVKATTRIRIFQWLVFNLLVGNADAHLKNLSFMADASGVSLAPHYDLISTTVYRDDHGWRLEEMTTPLGNATTFGQVSRADVLAAGVALGIPASSGARLLDNLIRPARKQAEALIAQAETGGSGFSAGEIRLLRQIAYGPLADMVQQLMEGG